MGMVKDGNDLQGCGQARAVQVFLGGGEWGPVDNVFIMNVYEKHTDFSESFTEVIWPFTNKYKFMFMFCILFEEKGL